MAFTQKIALLALLVAIFCSLVWVLRPAEQPLHLRREVLLRQECEQRLIRLAAACKKYKVQAEKWPFENVASGSKTLSWRDRLSQFIDASAFAAEIPQPMAFRCNKCEPAIESSYFPVVMPDGEFGLICGEPLLLQLPDAPQGLQEFVSGSRPIHSAGFILLRLSGSEEGRFSSGKTKSELTGVERAE